MPDGVRIDVEVNLEIDRVRAVLPGRSHAFSFFQSPTSIRMLRASQQIFLLWVFWLSASGFAEDYKPQVCAAVEYRGAALHPAIAAETLSAARHDVDGTIEGPLAAGLDEAVDWILNNTKAPGITAAVAIPGEGIWSVSRGLATVSPPAPLAETPYFHWASAGKAMTAAVVMQLIKEQKLSYDDCAGKMVS